MSLAARWGRFNLLGLLGVAVQLTVLAACSRMAPGHYLAATAAAVEVTLLHNFAWHVLYTWRGRVEEMTLSEPLLRFHLSNGAVSLLGNLGLMRVLVQSARLPVLLANGIAIVACSLVNFFQGENWVFAGKREPR